MIALIGRLEACWSLYLKQLAIARIVFTIATIIEPRQIEPMEVVQALLRDFKVGFGGMPTVPSIKYHVANVPAPVTCTTFLMTEEESRARLD